MTITALPTPPSRSDPDNFATRADAFVAALPNFVDEVNAQIAAGMGNASTLLGATWAAPGTIGSGTPNTGAFTTLAAGNTTITGTLSVGGNASVLGSSLLTLGGTTSATAYLTYSGSTLYLGQASTAVLGLTAGAVSVIGTLSTTEYVRAGSYTVGTLPSAATAGAGAAAYCTDAGGGAVMVTSNGTNWKLAGTQTTVS